MSRFLSVCLSQDLGSGVFLDPANLLSAFLLLLNPAGYWGTIEKTLSMTDFHIILCFIDFLENRYSVSIL